MGAFVNPKTGNHEMWGEKPAGYFTPDEWAAAHPPDPAAVAEAERLAAEIEAGRIITARTQRSAVQAESFSAAEFAVFARAGLFDAWAAGAKYQAGERLVYEGRVYEVVQAVTAQGHQPPDAAGMLAIYRPISADPDSGAEPDGTVDSPIPFIYGMDVASGKHYSYEGATWLAKGDMVPCTWYPGTAGMWQWSKI